MRITVRIRRAASALAAFALFHASFGVEAWSQVARGWGALEIRAPGAPGAAASAAISNAAPAGLVSLFPALQTSPSPLEHAAVLERVLARTGLEPRELEALPPEARAARVEAAAADGARRLISETNAANASSGDSVRAVLELNSLKHRSEDLQAALKLMNVENPDLGRELERNAGEIRAALVARGDAFAAAALAALSNPDGAAWHGRTAVVPVAGGAVALKFATQGKGVDGEGEGLDLASRFGLDAPVALPSRRGYIRPADAALPQARRGTAFMAYLLPGGLAAGFFAYLGDELPWVWSRAQRAEAVRSSALNAVDGMLRLAENGWIHRTLAPLSHSEASWAWDFWREAGGHMLVELPRHGPTAVHNWDSGLSYANIRLSGLADFEHLARPSDRDESLRAAGQNLFELSMLVVRAGYRNGIRPGTIAGILAEALRRRASGAAGENRVEIDDKVLRPLLTGIVRRFYVFYFLAGLLPRPWVKRFNDAVSKISARAVPEGEGLVMPGEVVHPLIMDVLKPYVEALGRSRHKDDPSTPYKARGAFSTLLGKAKGSRLKTRLLFALIPAQALLFGLETVPYFRDGRFRKPWVWREGADPDAPLRYKAATTLLHRTDPAALALIEKALEDPDQGVRETAAAALRKRRDDPELRALHERLLDSPHPDVRKIAVEALDRRADAEAFALVAKALDDPDAGVRESAGRIFDSNWMSRSHQDSRLPAVAEKMRSSPYPDIRKTAIAALRRRRDPEDLPLLEEALGDPDSGVRAAAIGVLQRQFFTALESPALGERIRSSPYPDVRRAIVEILNRRVGFESLARLALDDQDPGVRQAAIGALAHDSRAPEFAALVEKARSSPYPDVRRMAAERLRGRQDSESLSLVAETLEDPDPDVRAAAASALRARLDPESLPLVEKALNDPSAAVRGFGKVALVSRRDEPTVPALIDRIWNSPYSDARRAAIETLGSRAGPESFALLEKALDDQDPDVRQAASYALSFRRDPELGALHERMWNSPHPDVRMRAVEAIASASLTLVEAALNDADADVRQAAGRRLNSHKENPELPAFAGRMQESPYPDARRMALAALSGRQEEWFLPLIGKALDDADFGVRLAAAEVLRLRKDPEALPLAAKALDDPDLRVSRSATRILEHHRGPESLPLIEKAMENSDPAVRGGAIKALADREGPGSLALLENAMNDSDPAVRSSASAALRSRRTDPDLLALVEKMRRSPRPDVRKSAIELLEDRGDSESLPLIESAFGDKDLGVREAAASAAWRRKGPELFAFAERIWKSRYPDARRTAVEILDRREDSWPHALIRKALDDKDPGVRKAAAATARRRRRDPEFPSFFENMRKSRYADVRRAAVELLSRHDPEFFANIERALTDKDSSVRELAVRTLSYMCYWGDPESYALAEKMRESRHADVRKWAAERLKQGKASPPARGDPSYGRRRPY